ncbi:probable RNA methyltransferase CG11342 [Cloeon dipterum]|uniref:probable RNA methyltransferase CG11342 n=1 Tax=Cloeon dipterum TaxID=197152 RepID=UPI00322054C4
MEDPKLDFTGDNPGAVRHGNFINYYQFHPASERIQKLPLDIWTHPSSDKIVCLDVGCNTGELTVELLRFLQANLRTANEKIPKIHMVGVDLDPVLISRANEQFTAVESIEFKTLDVMKEDSLSHLESVAAKHGCARFAAVFLMSVTMWVHLTHGDKAFHLFLKNTANLAEKWVIIESQPWKCYRNAQRRLISSGARGFELYSKLTVKGVQIPKFVEKVLCDECGMKKIFETDPTKWNRTICIYEKY